MTPGRGIRLPFTLLRIPVTLDLSFLLILPLFAYLIGSQMTGYAELVRELGVQIDPARIGSGATPWLLGALGAVGLFSSVLVHELGHAVVARLYGVEVKEIRLWFLGGVAQMDEMPKARGGEAVVAVVGPITSALIGAALWLLLPAVRGSAGLTVLVSYLAITNIALALFNLLPALPLDGGRVLRGVLALFMPHVRATNVAAFVSGVIAILLGLYGFFSMNFLLVIMAFFVYNAGRAEAQAAVVAGAFEGRKVADVMTKDPISVRPDMVLSQFVRLAHYRPHAGYPVVDGNGKLLGYASIAAAYGVPAKAGGDPPASWPPASGEESLQALEGTVADILTPAATIASSEEALEALKLLAGTQHGRLMVVDGADVLVGVVGKRDLLDLLQPERA